MCGEHYLVNGAYEETFTADLDDAFILDRDGEYENEEALGLDESFIDSDEKLAFSDLDPESEITKDGDGFEPDDGLIHYDDPTNQCALTEDQGETACAAEKHYWCSCSGQFKSGLYACFKIEGFWWERCVENRWYMSSTTECPLIKSTVKLRDGGYRGTDDYYIYQREPVYVGLCREVT